LLAFSLGQSVDPPLDVAHPGMDDDNPPADDTLTAHDSPTMASIGDVAVAAATLEDIAHMINPVVHDDFDAHDCAMSSAITEASATPRRFNALADTDTTPTNSMTMSAEIVACVNIAILAQICTENKIHRAMV
jgi:hypothetical protein